MLDHSEMLDRLRDTFASVLEETIDEGVPHEAIRAEIAEELELQLYKAERHVVLT